MKKIVILAIASILSIATATAQTLLAHHEDTPAIYQSYNKDVQTEQDVVSYFESVKDASFPTEKEKQVMIDQLSNNPKQVAAGILNILLGDFGVGHFYTGQTLRGVLDILFCWTGIPAIIGLVEGIIWLCDSEEEWAERVANWNKE